MKEIHKKLHLYDTEDGDLIHLDDEKADEDGYSIIAMWNWERKYYFIRIDCMGLIQTDELKKMNPMFEKKKA